MKILNSKIIFFSAILFLIFFLYSINYSDKFDFTKIKNFNESNLNLKKNDSSTVDLILRSIYENLNFQILDFEDFDNQNGLNYSIVPNIIHLLYLQINEIKFYQLINIYSIYFNHNPDVILIHCDQCKFNGKYWNELNSFKPLKEKIKINKIKFHDKIFSVKYGWINHHRSDVLRLLVLMNYGGIFLDNDVYIVNSLNKYRKYEMTVSWDGDNEGVGVQTLIAHRNARLLKAHFDMYRTNYKPSEWYYNAGYVPAKILLKNRNLAHIVKINLGTHNLVGQLYHRYWPDWKNLDTIHLLINHRSYLDKNSPIKEFDELNILNYNFTYGEMCRDIMNKIKKFSL